MKVTAKTGRNSKLLLGLTQSSALACTQSTDQTKENFALDKDAKIVICLYPRITVRFLIAKKSLRLSRRLFFAIRRENRLSSFQPSRLLMQIVSDFKVGDGHRPGKIIPLSNVAVDLGEEIHLFLGLHPLANHLRVKRLRHFNNALNDAVGAVSLGAFPQKLFVDLEHIDRQKFEKVEGGITRAKIVHSDEKPHSLEPFEYRENPLLVADEGAFCHFQFDSAGRHFVALDNAGKPFKKIVLIEGDPGEVDGDRK